MMRGVVGYSETQSVATVVLILATREGVSATDDCASGLN